ncbi:hypothetical protein [Actinoplanes sp. NPDC026670]|uniref:hypothetical protein n=1 Tax=Actinoplanes sp. NPDC026670 TaxID=3154700 RepID=UPI0033EEA18D
MSDDEGSVDPSRIREIETTYWQLTNGIADVEAGIQTAARSTAAVGRGRNRGPTPDIWPRPETIDIPPAFDWAADEQGYGDRRD